MKQTKIVCTVGPACSNLEVMENLIKAGMNCARMNFSHGDHEFHKENIAKIKRLNKKLGTNVGVLLDTKGPEIRTHDFVDGEASLETGDSVIISMNEVLGTKEKFSITYSKLVEDVKKGDTILIDDGLIALEIIDVKSDEIHCVVENSGVVKNKKGVNIPNVNLSMDFISAKDDADIRLGATEDVDFIAASFTRRRQDILDIKKILKEEGNEDIKILAKIENQEGLDNLDEIIDECAGIMVARGDLGVEIPLEAVPSAQKIIIRKCNKAGKIVITATHLLDSMQRNPRPTRAESADVANAILDGSDAVMLSGETAAGLYPVESVEVMSTIAKYVEKDAFDYDLVFNRQVKAMNDDPSSAIAISVASTTHKLKPKYVVAATNSGYTAKLISSFRLPVPIIAVTPNEKTRTRLCLNWGVITEIVPLSTKAHEIEAEIKTLLTSKYNLQKNDQYIITAGMPISKVPRTNYMKIECYDE